MKNANSYKIFTFLMLTFAITNLSSCALAPIANTPSGRSVGAGNLGLDLGAVVVGSGIPSGKLYLGLSDNLDLGIQFETYSFGGFLKYSFINPKPKDDGLSLGIVGAGGIAGAGTYIYTGPVFGYKFGPLEPFAVIRFNSVKYKLKTVGGVSVAEGSFSYLSYSPGLVFWPTNWFGLMAEASFFSGTTGSDFSGAVLDAGVLFRF